MRKGVNTDMKISSFKYYFVDAFKSLVRNLTISIASAATVMATLFILGVFLLTMLNIEKGVSNVEDQVEIKVFLKDDITMTEQRDLEVGLKGTEGVGSVVFESKSEALKKFTEQLSEKDRSLLSGYDGTNNPMPNSFIIKLQAPEKAEVVAEKAAAMKGVESVGNDKEFVAKIIAVAKAIRIIGLVIFALLIAVSLFLIGNTIRLTVFSRRREIGIMKFVGATDWFIRWPFIIEGMIIGIAGAVVANILLFYSYKAAFVKITESLLAVQMISPYYVLSTMMWQFIAGGVAIGAVGSFLSLRKFLAV
jgi:cell division transport system permease protein